MRICPRICLPLVLFSAVFFVFTAHQAGAQITVGSDGPDETDASNYSGAQTLTKIGSNTVTLTGNNSYTGATTAQQGGLTVDAPGTLTGNTPLTVANGSNNAVFTLETGTANVRDLRVGTSTGAGVVIVNGGTMNSGGEMWLGTSPTNDASHHQRRHGEQRELGRSRTWQPGGQCLVARLDSGQWRHAQREWR